MTGPGRLLLLTALALAACTAERRGRPGPEEPGLLDVGREVGVDASAARDAGTPDDTDAGPQDAAADTSPADARDARPRTDAPPRADADVRDALPRADTGDTDAQADVSDGGPAWPPRQHCPDPVPDPPLVEGAFEEVAVLFGRYGHPGAADLDGDGRAEVWYHYDGSGTSLIDDTPSRVRVVAWRVGWSSVVVDEWVRTALVRRAIGDLDRDGLLEIVGQGDTPARGNVIAIAYEQAAPATLEYQRKVLLDLGVVQVGRDWRIADLQQDGRPELITDYFIGIYESLGDDTLDPVVRFDDPPWGPDGARHPPISQWGGLNVGDFDGDGRLEVGYASSRELYDQADTLKIVEPTEAGDYVVTWESALEMSQLFLAADGDADGDGRPELLRGGRGHYFMGGGAWRYCWWFGLLGADGDDSYSVRWDLLLFHGGMGDTGEAAMGDTDGDGDAEVVLSLGSRVHVLELDQATGQFVRLLTVDSWKDPPDLHMTVATGDLDGDGRDEVLIGQEGSVGDLPEETEAVRVYRRLDGR